MCACVCASRGGQRAATHLDVWVELRHRVTLVLLGAVAEPVRGKVVQVVSVLVMVVVVVLTVGTCVRTRGRGVDLMGAKRRSTAALSLSCLRSTGPGTPRGVARGRACAHVFMCARVYIVYMCASGIARTGYKAKMRHQTSTKGKGAYSKGCLAVCRFGRRTPSSHT